MKIFIVLKYINAIKIILTKISLKILSASFNKMTSFQSPKKATTTTKKKQAQGWPEKLQVSVPRRCEGCPGKERAESVFSREFNIITKFSSLSLLGNRKSFLKSFFLKRGLKKKRNFVTNNILTKSLSNELFLTFVLLKFEVRLRRRLKRVAFCSSRYALSFRPTCARREARNTQSEFNKKIFVRLGMQCLYDLCVYK